MTLTDFSHRNDRRTLTIINGAPGFRPTRLPPRRRQIGA
jgi:hypothetical protein